MLGREQLSEVFDARPEPFCALRAIRGEQGIRDFRFEYVNPAALRLLRWARAEEVEGHLLLEVAPSHGPTGLFERYVRVVETGQTDRHSFFYAGERVSGWFTTVAVRWGDGLTVTFRDDAQDVQAREPLRTALAGSRASSPARELLEAMLRHLPARVALLSLPDFVLEYVNDAFLEGIQGRPLLGKRAADLFPELLDHPLAAGVRQCLATGTPYVNPEVPLRLDFGRGIEERIFSVVYQPVADAEGHPVALLGFHFDITRQAEARACTEALLREKEQLASQLEEERRWQKAVLTDVSQGLAVLAADGDLLFCNPRMEELLGRQADAAPRLVAELFPSVRPDGRRIPEAERPFHRAVSSGLPVRNVPAVYPHPVRGDITLDVSVAPILDAGRTVTAAIVTVDDVTERHRLEHERGAALSAEREARLQAEALARDLARSEERFRSLVETSSQAIWTTDWSGYALTVAPGWCALTGQTHEEAKGRGWLAAIHPNDLGAMQQMLRDGLKTLQPQSVACRVRRADGEWAECVARGVPLLDEGGRVAGVGGDGARRQRRAPGGSGAAASLQHRGRAIEHLGRFRDAAGGDAAGGPGARGLLHRGRAARGRDTRAGGGGACAAGGRRGGGASPPVRARLRGAAGRGARAPHAGAAAGDECPGGARRQGPRRAHREVLAAIQGRSLLAVPLLARGRPLGVIGFFYSHSDRRYGPLDVALAEEVCRRAAAAIDNARLYQRAEEANRAKDDFLATVSHELRTPLSAILGWTRLLRGGGLSPEKHARALETLERNARAQARLVEDLLDVSRIVAGETRLAVAPVEVARVVDAALEALRPAAEAKEIALRVALDRSLMVAGDADRLQQVTWNLLSNAIKFTPPKGSIAVRLEQSAGHAALSVTDDGQGITAEFLPHVFERFRQRLHRHALPHRGLGLGCPSSGTWWSCMAAPSLRPAAGLARRHFHRSAGPPGRGRAGPQPPRWPGCGCWWWTTRRAAGTVVHRAGPAARPGQLCCQRCRGAGRPPPRAAARAGGRRGHAGGERLPAAGARPQPAPGPGGRTPAVALSAQSGPGDRQRALRAGFQVYVWQVETAELVSVLAELVASATTWKARVGVGTAPGLA